MFELDKVGSLYYSLPPNMQDAYSHAFCYAFDRQMEKLLPYFRALQLWTDLDSADPKYYDHMAATLAVPYYKSEYSDETKLGLIKGAIKARTYAGTYEGINDFFETVFDVFSLMPWYEYGGDPYHFKVRASGQRTPDVDSQFVGMLKKMKAARSVMDAVETERSVEENIYVAVAVTTSAKITILNSQDSRLLFEKYPRAGIAANSIPSVVI